MTHVVKNLAVSVVILTKNEQDNIEECIRSAAWADEVIVFDSGSADETTRLAREQGARIVAENSDWPGFGLQRQKAERVARNEWILMLDADERITKDLIHEIGQVINQGADRTAYAFPRLTFCFGAYIRHGGWYPDYVERLYRRGEARWNSDLVHENLIVGSGVTVRRLRYPLIHLTYAGVPQYLRKSALYAEAWAADRDKAGRTASLVTATLHALGAMLKMYVLRLGFLDGKAGFLLATLSGYAVFSKYATLWDLSRSTTRARPGRERDAPENSPDKP